jgi:hypothetical protein
MACIFPKTMIDDVRRAWAANRTPERRDVHFPGKFVGELEGLPSPGTQAVGATVAPICCSSCGGELPEGTPTISFMYDAWPDDARSGAWKSWIHVEKCKHVGG